ncbi:hypothetical protein [Saccharothrix australiensis]|uniref:Uncharacterized protein n=1 Tax=Saccharothrix australiensis TaxID=2072 RepID=A0A495VLP1_9PSEU|nr:hypothetical protein [Saccharothrix australiensis]RKT49363.1 hypothetical protein C8E97_6742 [Saccharothrix australiensis]
MANRDLVFTILGIDKASPAFRSAGDAAERAGQRIDQAGATAIKTMGGVAAASTAGGAAAALAIGGLPVLFGATAAAAVASNEQVANSFSNLADNVVDDVRTMSAPLVDDFVYAANEVGRAWGRDVAPVLKSIFADPAMAHGVRELASGVGELAAEAMPGMLESVRASGPVMTGFRSVLRDTGSGVSDFFDNVADSSDSSARVITGFGRIVEDVLGDAGEVIGDLADVAAPHMDRVEQVVERAGDSLLGLADGALPIMADAAGAGISAVSGFLSVLEPFQNTLGAGVGVALAAAGGWRLLTAAGNGFSKLDLGGRLERTALSAGIMTESLTGSATAGERVASAGSRMGTVLSRVGSAIPIVGAGVAALSLVLDISAERMRTATADGAHLAESLIKGGSEADRARARIATLSAENTGYRQRLGELEAAQRGAGKAAGAYSSDLSELRDRIDANNATIRESQRRYDEIRNSLTGAELAQVKYNEAVERYGTASPEAAAAGAAWRAALDEERRKANEAAEATRTHTDRIVEQQNVMLGAAGAGLGYRGALLGVESAQKALNDATNRHGRDSLEAREASLAYEQALLGAVTALGEKTAAENASASESERARLVTQAQAAEILRLAAAAGTNAPESLRNMVQALDATTLAAIGVTGRITETGAAIYRLPDGKEILLTGDHADAIRKIDEVNARQMRDKTLYINLVTRQDSRVADDFGGPGRAHGGRVRAGQPVTVGEEGRERLIPAGDGYVLPHTQTVALERAERLAGLGGAGGTPVTLHYHLTVVNASNSEIDLRTQFRRLEDEAGL